MLTFTLTDVKEYELPPATPTTLGGVIPSSSYFEVGGLGELTLNPNISLESVTFGSDNAFIISQVNGPLGETAIIESNKLSLIGGSDVNTKAIINISPQSANNSGVTIFNADLNIQHNVNGGNVTADGIGSFSKVEVRTDLVVDRSEFNTSIQYMEISSTTADFVSVGAGTHCLICAIDQPVQNFVIQLPAVAGDIAGREVEISISGNATKLSIVSVEGVPVMGAPVEVNGYLAMKFRSVNRPDNVIQYFLIA